jgi:hypothetical protein
MGDAEVDAVRAIHEPIEQARRATELIHSYERRTAELAVVRLEAIERAKVEYDLTYTARAERMGLTKGRLTQVRQAGAQRRQAAERGRFGDAATPYIPRGGPLLVALARRILDACSTRASGLGDLPNNR